MNQLHAETWETNSAVVDSTLPLQIDVHVLDLTFDCRHICSFLLILPFLSTFFIYF